MPDTPRRAEKNEEQSATGRKIERQHRSAQWGRRTASRAARTRDTGVTAQRTRGRAGKSFASIAREEREMRGCVARACAKGVNIHLLLLLGRVLRVLRVGEGSQAQEGGGREELHLDRRVVACVCVVCAREYRDANV